MKLKTYFLTLLLFLLFFNGSILLISIVNLNTNLNSIRERCLGEHYFIVSAYSKDLKAVMERGATEESALKSLFGSYVSYYGQRGVFLEVAKGGETIGSSMPQVNLLAAKKAKLTKNNRLLATAKLNGKEYMGVVGKFPSPYSDYTLAYFYDFSEYMTSWNKMTGVLFLIGVALSFGLAVCLLILLNHIFKPLKQISVTSQKIAGGEYAGRLIVQGKDELAEMAQSFNGMADEIQNKIAELAKAAEQKQCFIDNFAHELRTPLTAIYGYAEYIQKAAIPETEKLAATDYIMHECDRLQNLAYRLLDLAMLRHAEIEFGEVSVPLLLQSTIDELCQKAAAKQVGLAYDCQVETVKGDFELLKCLLVNLADNGLKACAQGGTVKLKAAYEAGRTVFLVRDNGKGMTATEIQHITEAFFRVDKARSRAEGGVGLGLTLCEQISCRHSAKITFISKPNLGTTVKITFTT